MTKKTSYLMLAFSIAAELVGSTYLVMSKGYTLPGPTAISVIAYIACFFVFSKALLKINLSIAYATWSAVGTVAASLISVIMFGQPLSKAGIFGIVLIVAGVILLNLYGAPKEETDEEGEK